MFRIAAALLLMATAVLADSKPAIPSLRWIEGAPNCTLARSDDGHVSYGISSGDFDITMSVDRQELEKVPRRAFPMIGVFVSVHYKGNGQFDVLQNQFSLEFLKHFQVIQTSLDPDAMLQQMQTYIDDVTDEIERHQLRKHPEQKEEKEKELQARLKDYTEMMDFISTRALRPTSLDRANSATSGWVFFSTKNRWIGRWRRPEQLILRMPVENLAVEFPFELPPKLGKLELRRRPGD
jgi:ribosome-associated translation inhibitor RaiA